MKFFRIFWIVLIGVILLITLYGFDGRPNSDIGVVLAWTGLFLSFPSGLLVPLTHVILYEIFSVGLATSYVSLTFDWAGFAVLGYMQWFVFLPWLVKKIREKGPN